VTAAVAGFGLAYMPEDLAQPHLARGRLKRMLDDSMIVASHSSAASEHLPPPGLRSHRPRA
jgi:DNA-binding transcriptional LysR family regulator